MAKGAATPASFKPGQTGNPNGRPKRTWTWASLYEKAVEELEGKEQVKDAVAKKLAELASKGDIVAIKELANRMDGMPKQTIDATVITPEPIYGSKSKI